MVKKEKNIKRRNDEGGKGRNEKAETRPKGRKKGRQGNLVGNAVGFIWIAQ